MTVAVPAVAADTGQPLSGHDPTVCSPEELALIQEKMGLRLEDTDPMVLQLIVDRSRQAGNDAFKSKNHKEAAKMYSQAIAGAPSDHTLFGNRSAAYLALGLYEEAAWDARKAAKLAPDWPKAYYRLGCALLGLSQWSEAARVLQQGLTMDPGNADMAAKAAEAERRTASEVAARRSQADTERRGIVAQLRAARRADVQQGMLNQFKQSMAGPEWEVEDLEWRPTFLPAMRLKPVAPEVVAADPRRRLLAGYMTALADLAHPKAALRILEDVPRLKAFQQGIEAALAKQQPGTEVLVLEAGGGLLSLLAAQAGAGSVTAIQRSRMLYRMARQCLEANTQKHAELAEHVCLLDRRLQAVGVRGEPLPPDALLALEQRRQFQQAVARRMAPNAPSQGSTSGISGDSNGSSSISGVSEEEVDEVASLLPRRASLLVTDLFDHSVLGMGLLPALDYAAERLLAPGAVVVPARMQVYAVLLELHVGNVSGFDLTALNTYWWHPSIERLDLSRLPSRRLSAPFPVHNLDLQARLDARLRQGQGSSPGNGSSQATAGNSSANSQESGEAPQAGGASSRARDAVWEFDDELEVPVTADGQWNAIAFWFHLHTGADGDGALISSWAGACGSSAGHVSASGPASAPVEQSAAGEHQAGGCAGLEAPQVATSLDPAVQYVDTQAVSRGATVKIRVRQDSGQYVFTTQPPQCRPRHALVPRWHFDMVLDTQRNDAYNDAIRRAVRRKRAAGCANMLALDMGAGSGLLSMMAARAGADEVYGAEMSVHMCDVGEEATIMNGFLGRINMLDRDVRRLDVFRKPDGTPPDMPRRADLLVYEVFDSGCIGEGVLHLLAAAQAKLVASDAEMVPVSARVYCQPIQMRVHSVLGFDCSQANRWRWRPDYEGLELGKSRHQWVPLAEPVEAFYFDFRCAAAHMRPEEALLDLRFNAAGVFNAVAMWFELDLDEDTTLSTSPYSDKGLTWQQAVQWVEELEVQAGQQMHLVARHDTYSISYSLPEEQLQGGEASQTAAQDAQGPRPLVQVAPGEEVRLDKPAALQMVPEPGPHSRQVGQPRRTDVPLVDPVWKDAFQRLQGLNSELAKTCVQNPLEYRAVAEAAVQFAVRPYDLGVDAQQAVEFCVRMMG